MLVPDPEALDQLPHIVYFVLQVLVLPFDHEYFLFSLFLLVYQFIFPLLLGLDFKLHLSVLRHQLGFFGVSHIVTEEFLL